MINILVIAVLGGMRHPIGPFIGAIVFVLLQNFAIDLVDPRALQHSSSALRSSSIVLFSPDGLLGLWEKARRWLRDRAAPRAGLRGSSKGQPGGRDQAASNRGRRKTMRRLIETNRCWR